jgi:hypothetical protein
MQKAPKILNYKNLAFEKYEYGQPFKQPNGTYQTTCTYRLSKNEVLPFYFETPKLRTTSGIVRLDNKYYMDLELPQTGSGDISGFYNFILKLDEHNITMCHKNCKDWFNQHMPLDVIETYYKSSIILRPSGQLPVIRIRLPSYKSNILTEIYNIKKEKVNDILCIQADDYIVGILEFTGLAFMSQSFTPIFEMQKIKIFKENEYRALPSGYIFSDYNEKIDFNKITTPDDEDKLINDTILEKPSTSFPIPIKQILPIEQESLPTSKQVIANGKEKQHSGHSLFDIIKNISLKGILDDDEIFTNHSNLIHEARLHKEQQRKLLLEKQQLENTKNTLDNIIDNKTTNNYPNILIPTEATEATDAIDATDATEATDATDAIKNKHIVAPINNQYSNLDSQNILDNPMPSNNDDNLSDCDNLADDDDSYSNYNDEDIYDNATSEIDTSDDGVDYQILDDLEVVVFDD